MNCVRKIYRKKVQKIVLTESENKTTSHKSTIGLSFHVLSSNQTRVDCIWGNLSLLLEPSGVVWLCSSKSFAYECISAVVH